MRGLIKTYGVCMVVIAVGMVIAVAFNIYVLVGMHFTLLERREILRERAAIVAGYDEHVDGKPDREYEWTGEYTVKPREGAAP